MRKSILLSIFSIGLLSLCSCRGGNNNQHGGETVTFWGYGEPTEIKIFRDLVDTFNAAHEGEIYVEYVTKPGSSYYGTVQQVIAGNRCPDVVYVGDDICKSWADNDYIIPLDDYVKNSEIIKLDEIWESGIERYRFNPQNRKSGGNENGIRQHGCICRGCWYSSRRGQYPF